LAEPNAIADLIRAAAEARTRAHAPYSTFLVGAALETASGTVVTGCNVESASYGLTICAERVALTRAIADGHREFRRLVVTAVSADPTPPCGACRQLLWELAGDIDVILASPDGERVRYRLSQLLPVPFVGGLGARAATRPPARRRRRPD